MLSLCIACHLNHIRVLFLFLMRETVFFIISHLMEQLSMCISPSPPSFNVSLEREPHGIFFYPVLLFCQAKGIWYLVHDASVYRNDIGPPAFFKVLTQDDSSAIFLYGDFLVNQ